MFSVFIHIPNTPGAIIGLCSITGHKTFHILANKSEGKRFVVFILQEKTLSSSSSVQSKYIFLSFFHSLQLVPFSHS